MDCKPETGGNSRPHLRQLLEAVEQLPQLRPQTRLALRRLPAPRRQRACGQHGQDSAGIQLRLHITYACWAGCTSPCSVAGSGRCSLRRARPCCHAAPHPPAKGGKVVEAPAGGPPINTSVSSSELPGRGKQLVPLCKAGGAVT